MMRLVRRVALAALLVLLAGPLHAARSRHTPRPRPAPRPAELRFPARVSEPAMKDLLAAARPSLPVSAAILAIARVESGFNPYSENPNSTACGILQFIEATCEVYASPREACFDPNLNAWAGVRHLTSIYGEHVREALPPRPEMPDELQRAEQAYQLLYAYHYHGSASPFALVGGSIDSQLAAEEGLTHLRRFYGILKRATYVPSRIRRAPVSRAAKRPSKRWKAQRPRRQLAQRS